MLLRRLILCAFALTLAACDSSTLEIIPLDPLDAASLAGLEVTVRGRTFTESDFTPRVALGVPGSGRIDGHVALVRDGRTLAEGDFGWTLQKGWDWSLFISRRAADPTFGCFGCSPAIRFPVDPSMARQPGDALWVYWAGGPSDGSIVY
jgi:hypothetical protein